MERKHRKKKRHRKQAVYLTEDEYFWFCLFRDNGMLKKRKNGEKAAEEVMRNEGRYERGWAGAVRRWMRRNGIR